MKAGDEITWSYQISSHPESDPASPVDPIVPVENNQPSPVQISVPVVDVEDATPPSPPSPVQLSVPVVDVEDEPLSPVQLSVPFVVDVQDETPPSPVPVQPRPFPTALFPPFSSREAPTGDEFFQTQFPPRPIRDRSELPLDRNLVLESRRNVLRQHLTSQLGQTIVFTASEQHAQDFGDCPVCQEKFQTNDTIRMQSCLHKFHDACLMECYTRYIEERVHSTDIFPSTLAAAQVNFKCPVCKTTTRGQGEALFSSNIGVQGK